MSHLCTRLFASRKGLSQDVRGKHGGEELEPAQLKELLRMYCANCGALRSTCCTCLWCVLSPPHAFTETK